MSKAQHILPYTIYPQGEGLSVEDRDLLQQAKEATYTSLCTLFSLLRRRCPALGKWGSGLWQ